MVGATKDSPHRLRDVMGAAAVPRNFAAYAMPPKFLPPGIGQLAENDSPVIAHRLATTLYSSQLFLSIFHATQGNSHNATSTSAR